MATWQHVCQHCAALAGQTGAVRLLLTCGGVAELENSYSQTPRDVATENAAGFLGSAMRACTRSCADVGQCMRGRCGHSRCGGPSGGLAQGIARRGGSALPRSRCSAPHCTFCSPDNCTTLPKPWLSRLSSGAAASTGMDAEAPRAAEGRGGGRRRRCLVVREGFHPPSHGVTITPPQNISQMHS